MNTRDLALFIDIAQYGSITQAAQQHNISPANASAALKRLEFYLEKKLFIRSTRHLSLTQHGRSFLPYAKSCVQGLNQGIQALNDEEISGVIRISAPTDFGRSRLGSWLDEFMQLNPKVSCYLHLSDTLTNFHKEAFDLAIRYGRTMNSRHIVYPLVESVYRVLCAAPEYIARRGPLTGIDQLTQHDVLLLSKNNRVEYHWELYSDQERHLIKLQSRHTSNDAQIIRLWAIEGCGIALKTWTDVYTDISKGHLLHLLPKVRSLGYPLSMVTTQPITQHQAIKALHQFLYHKCTVYFANKAGFASHYSIDNDDKV